MFSGSGGSLLGGGADAMSASAGAAGGGGGWMALAPSIISAIGGGVTNGTAAAARRDVANYYADVAEGNARLVDLQASDAAARSIDQQAQISRQTGQLIGRQRAATAASGVSLNEGSPVAVDASTRWMRDVDLATLRNNAARAAWGYNVQKQNYRTQAGAYRAGADAVSPTMAVGGTLLNNAAGVATKWYDLYKNGAFGSSASSASTDVMPSGSSVFSSSGLLG